MGVERKGRKAEETGRGREQSVPTLFLFGLRGTLMVQIEEVFELMSGMTGDLLSHFTRLLRSGRSQNSSTFMNSEQRRVA
jgi:hypothetical protein